MIEELRHYVAVPGKRDTLVARFKNDTMSLFKRHGIDVTAFWVAQNDPDTLYYMCRFADVTALKAAWKTFLADPDWDALKTRTESNGPLVASIKSYILEPVAGI